MDAPLTCPCDTSCDTTCSVHFACSKGETLPPLTPYSQLLSSSAGPPTDLQATVIWAEIERTEAAISAADAHLCRLRSAVEKLLQYRQKLESSTAAHRGMLSALRRLPNEILVEIFQYTNVPWRSALSRVPWLVSHVCSHWRAVVMASPVLWRHITTGRVRDSVFATNMLPLQLQCVRGAQVSVQFHLEPSPSFLALCLGISPQWEELELNVKLFLTPPLANQNFPGLKRLTLTGSRLDASQVSNNSNILPALEHLTLLLYDRGLPRSLSLPWSQLRQCDLKYLNSGDLLWVLGNLSHADVSVVGGDDNTDDDFPPVAPTTSSIRALTITEGHCQFFLTHVLDDLSTPALERLTLYDNGVYPSSLGAQIARFLDRSACSLTDLCIDHPLPTEPEDDQLPLLNSPHIRSVARLALPATTPSSKAITTLASLPNLRHLTLWGDAMVAGCLVDLFKKQGRPVISTGGSAVGGELQVVLLHEHGTHEYVFAPLETRS